MEATIDPVLGLRDSVVRAEGRVESEDSDFVAIRAAQRGDRDAFDHIYRQHALLVHGILLSRVPPQDADDLMQEVFLSAWRQLPSLREPGALCGWLIQIARNRATDFHRRRRDMSELPEAFEANGPRNREDVEANAALAAIQELPEAYRETLVLRLVEGLTGPEIAERTGLAHGSVRVNLHRGMKLLRQSLGESS